jgi:hypothetical protein
MIQGSSTRSAKSTLRRRAQGLCLPATTHRIIEQALDVQVIAAGITKPLSTQELP